MENKALEKFITYFESSAECERFQLLNNVTLLNPPDASESHDLLVVKDENDLNPDGFVSIDGKPSSVRWFPPSACGRRPIEYMVEFRNATHIKYELFFYDGTCRVSVQQLSKKT